LQLSWVQRNCVSEQQLTLLKQLLQPEDHMQLLHNLNSNMSWEDMNQFFSSFIAKVMDAGLDDQLLSLICKIQALSSILSSEFAKWMCLPGVLLDKLLCA
jgi:hypothetical protein